MVRVFSDDGKCVHDAALMLRALEQVKAFGGVVSQHAQDLKLADNHACCHEGELSLRPGLPGWPAVAEQVIVAGDVMLRLAGPHRTCPRLARLRSSAWPKAQGIAVTAEVTPHHLLLTTDLLAGCDPTFTVNPPLRPSQDTQMLQAALANGTIDAVVTDHAPHARRDKERSFIDGRNQQWPSHLITAGQILHE